MAPDPKVVAAFDTFRAKRNKGIYDLVGAVSEAEADEMQAIAQGLASSLAAWLAAEFAHLV